MKRLLLPEPGEPLDRLVLDGQLEPVQPKVSYIAR
jgi:hypothetical protein